MNNLNEFSVQSNEKIRLKKIFGKGCLPNNLSSETDILTFAVKRCEKMEARIKKLEEKKEILENDLKMKREPWKKLKFFLTDLASFCRERNIKLKVADRLDYCDLLDPYHKIVCTYRRNESLIKKLKKDLQYIKLFIFLSK